MEQGEEFRATGFWHYKPGDVLDNGWVLQESAGNGRWKAACPRCSAIVIGKPASLRTRKGCRKCPKKLKKARLVVASSMVSGKQKRRNPAIGDVLNNGWIARSNRDVNGKCDLECPNCKRIIKGQPKIVETQQNCRECGPKGGARRVEKVSTGEVYPSAAAAAIANGISGSTLSAAIRSGREKGGSRWEITNKEVTVFSTTPA